MKALILAAGMATRLRPLTLNTPKCLLKIGNRTLLQRSLDALIENDIRDIVIVTGYLHSLIEAFVEKQYGNSIHITFIHNERYDSTNNIYSLWLARKEAEGEDVLLLDSDLLYDKKIVSEVLSYKAENVLSLIRHELGEEEIKVIVDEKGEIVELNKTCDPSKAIGESLGIEKMSKKYTFALYKELEKMMLQEHLENRFYEVAFERLAQQGQRFAIVDVTSFFSCELDTIDDFEHAKQILPVELY